MNRASQRTDSDGRIYARRVHFEGGGGDIVGVTETPDEIQAAAEQARNSGEEWVMVTLEAGLQVGFKAGTPFVVDEVELHEEAAE